jgi:ABC-type sugar transport system substrate-binding protein
MKCWFRVRETGESWTKGNMNRLLGSLAGVVLLVVAAWASIGCDSNSFVPPRPEELQGVVGGTTDTANGSAARVDLSAMPSSGKGIELVLDWHGAEETEVLKSAARTQAGHDTARLKIAVLGEKDSSSRQAELVREAVARHSLALVLEPADPSDPGLALAVREAQDAGVPVVLFGRALAVSQPVEVAHADAKTGKVGASPAPIQGTQASPGSRPARPPIVVMPPSFVPSAQLIVASAIRNAKNAGITPQKAAVLLVDTRSDSFVEQRVTAVRDALKAHQITTIKEIRFESDSTRAARLLSDFLRANPDIVLVFALDYHSFIATRQVSNDLAAERSLIKAGYTSDEQLANTTQFGEFAALAEFTPTRLIRKAITTAGAAAQGRDVPRRVEVQIIFHDSPEKTGVVKSQAKGQR